MVTCDDFLPALFTQFADPFKQVVIRAKSRLVALTSNLIVYLSQIQDGSWSGKQPGKGES